MYVFIFVKKLNWPNKMICLVIMQNITVKMYDLHVTISIVEPGMYAYENVCIFNHPKMALKVQKVGMFEFFLCQVTKP